MKKSLRLFLFLCLAILALAACGPANHNVAADLGADPPTDAAEFGSEVDLLQTTVELDVFSGLPNPVWNLTDEQTLELVTLLGNLPECDQSVNRFEGLGYRGFLVSLVAPESRAITALYAGDGVVELGEGVGKICSLDADQQVEKWLLESGRGPLDEELFSEIWDVINK